MFVFSQPMKLHEQDTLAQSFVPGGCELETALSETGVMYTCLGLTGLVSFNKALGTREALPKAKTASLQQVVIAQSIIICGFLNVLEKTETLSSKMQAIRRISMNQNGSERTLKS